MKTSRSFLGVVEHENSVEHRLCLDTSLRHETGQLGIVVQTLW